MPGQKLREWLISHDANERAELLAQLSEEERDALSHHWRVWARPQQLAPTGPWRVWLICAGRGFGKTRAGAEWVKQVARDTPDARIALVGASMAEARSIMVEGESGLLENCAAAERPQFEPSRGRLTFASGAHAYLYSAAEPESLRGPQHSHAWCDEIAKWDNASERAMRAWDNLQMGMRLSETPQTLATTTPRNVTLMKRLLKGEKSGDVTVTRGTTFDNASNLPAAFVKAMQTDFGESRLGRQELHGEMLSDIEGALWTRVMLDNALDTSSSSSKDRELVRIVVAVDPPASAKGDACGIIVAGIDASGTGHVLADCTVEQVSPEQWARAVANAAQEWEADRVVAEANQGGAMVSSVLQATGSTLPIKLVHASRSKSARAEPIAALYEAGRVAHKKMFAQLEDQLCGLIAGGGYQGPGRSPDRADALVWALTELMLTPRGAPNIRRVR
ncbi:DNA-packaging protein [Erythrobacter sp. W53]|uniref:DNA-packaging protein n=1 Tax=Erythrobacter sp. W53 TaxID=3425947 RepID=UPI003D7675D3